MRRTVCTLLLAAALVVTAAASPAQGAVRGSPDLSASVADGRVSPGQVTTLGVTVVNAGNVTDGSARDPNAEQRVTTARGLALRMRSGDAPIEVRTGTVAVGSLPEGAAGPLEFAIAVDEDAEPGTYEVPVVAEYRYTSRITGEQGGERAHEAETVTETLTVTVRVEEGARFEVVGTDTDAPVGGSGTVELTLENVGTGPARDAAVTVQSPDGALGFGEAATAETYVGRWAPGEVRTLEFDAAIAPATAARPLSLRATVGYEDDDGTPREESLATGVVPAPEQTFALRNVTADLRVDADGTLAGTVTNEGPGGVDNAVLVLDPPENVNAVETEYALGDLGAGESVDFEYDLSVSSSARQGPRQFTFRVRYEGTGGEGTEGDPLYARGEVGPRRGVFAVEPVDHRVEDGGSGRLVLSVTNAGEEPLTDISAKLFADDPISADDSEAFVDRLAPGESTRVVFGVSAAGGMNKTYPVSVDFQYDDADGDTHVSNTYRVPVRVTQSENGGLPLAVVGVVLLALLAAGWFAYTRYPG